MPRLPNEDVRTSREVLIDELISKFSVLGKIPKNGFDGEIFGQPFKLVELRSDYRVFFQGQVKRFSSLYLVGDWLFRIAKKPIRN